MNKEYFLKKLNDIETLAKKFREYNSKETKSIQSQIIQIANEISYKNTIILESTMNDKVNCIKLGTERADIDMIFEATVNLAIMFKESKN